jgi:hypothetical protein
VPYHGYGSGHYSPLVLALRTLPYLFFTRTDGNNNVSPILLLFLLVMSSFPAFFEISINFIFTFRMRLFAGTSGTYPKNGAVRAVLEQLV